MIKYKISQKVDPRDVNLPMKYYAIKQPQEALTLRDFAKRISRESTVSSMDAIAVLEGLLQIIPDEIANGKIIKLGEFGTFRTTLSSEGTATEAAFDATNIKRVNIRFRPTKAFRSKLANVTFQKVA